MSPEKEISVTEANELICPICQCNIEPGEDTKQCLGCKTAYHVECWEENTGCAVYGCEYVPPTDALHSLKIPLSYWGQERKECPQCKAVIQAVAIRCRYCGSLFPSVEPMSAIDYQNYLAQRRRLPIVRIISRIIFVLCVIPCIAPFGMIAAVFWYKIKKKDIQALRGMEYTLLRIGIGVALAQIVLYAIIGLIFAVT